MSVRGFKQNPTTYTQPDIIPLVPHSFLMKVSVRDELVVAHNLKGLELAYTAVNSSIKCNNIIYSAPIAR